MINTKYVGKIEKQYTFLKTFILDIIVICIKWYLYLITILYSFLVKRLRSDILLFYNNLIKLFKFQI